VVEGAPRPQARILCDSIVAAGSLWFTVFLTWDDRVTEVEGSPKERIFADAEKAFVSVLDTKFNETKYPKCPSSIFPMSDWQKRADATPFRPAERLLG
jgi:hypothetical protein